MRKILKIIILKSMNAATFLVAARIELNYNYYNLGFYLIKIIIIYLNSF